MEHFLFARAFYGWLSMLDIVHFCQFYWRFLGFSTCSRTVRVCGEYPTFFQEVLLVTNGKCSVACHAQAKMVGGGTVCGVPIPLVDSEERVGKLFCTIYFLPNMRMAVTDAGSPWLGDGCRMCVDGVVVVDI